MVSNQTFFFFFFLFLLHQPVRFVHFPSLREMEPSGQRRKLFVSSSYPPLLLPLFLILLVFFTGAPSILEHPNNGTTSFFFFFFNLHLSPTNLLLFIFSCFPIGTHNNPSIIELNNHNKMPINKGFSPFPPINLFSFSIPHYFFLEFQKHKEDKNGFFILGRRACSQVSFPWLGVVS